MGVRERIIKMRYKDAPVGAVVRVDGAWGVKCKGGDSGSGGTMGHADFWYEDPGQPKANQIVEVLERR